MKIVFLDTMIYMHYLPVEDIDFLSILDSSEVTIIVPRITVQELDKQKDTNASRKLKDRARRVLQNFERWFEHGQSEIRKSTQIQYYGKKPVVNLASLGLDKDRGDDYLIATIIEYINENPDRDVILITQDTGPKLTARDHGIATLSLPDSLRLKEKLDPLEKENRELKQQLEKLKNVLPKPAVCFFQNETRNNLLEVNLVEPNPDPKEEIEERIGSLKEQYQPYDSSMAAIYSQEETDRYNIALTDYFKDYERYMAQCVDAENEARLWVEFQLELFNEGTGPADDLDIKLRFHKNVSIIRKRDFERRKPEIHKPEPPMAPRTMTQMMFENIMSGSALSALGSRSWESTLPPIMPFTGAIGAIAPPTRNFEISKDGHAITAEIKKLKHNDSWPLPELVMKFCDFESASSFSVDYRIRVANLPDEITGELHVKVTKVS